ncbi:MAG: iron-containing alcohol dehydrogenase [Syntrophales bacterium]|jgi:alcohol dehydrogenase|nr:iron-containing alcohol dehydrogenase [Syntrophales bacterium]
MNDSRIFQMPSVVHFGSGAAAQAGPEAARLGAKKALLVTDEILMQTGAVKPVIDSLGAANIETVIFDKIASEPVIKFVEEGLQLLRQKKCDVLVAVGGGSPIDTAKAIAVMAANPGKIEDYMGIGKIKNPGMPLIAIPTTAGTGSEVTIFTIITDTKRDVKMLIGSPHVMPRIALVDPLMTLGMPRGLTAATGLDALTHAIEAYVSLKAQPLSDVMALSAIERLFKNLPQAWANPNNIEARTQTLLGAMQAGIAFSNASVALVHGMSRPLGAYFHIPHGLSNATLLGDVMEFSIMGNPVRYARITEAMGVDITGLLPTEAAEEGAMLIKKLVADLEVPSIKELGVDKKKLDEVVEQMAKDAIASGSPGNNPRIATPQEIVSLYYKAFQG